MVGVPSFLYQNQVSPLSLGGAFGGVTSNLRNSNFASNAIMTQVSGDSNISPATNPTTPDEEQVASFSATQLFLYQGSQINLKKGERMSMRLFSMTVPCSKVFEWTIDDTNNSSNNSETAAYQINRI